MPQLQFWLLPLLRQWIREKTNQSIRFPIKPGKGHPLNVLLPISIIVELARLCRQVIRQAMRPILKGWVTLLSLKGWISFTRPESGMLAKTLSLKVSLLHSKDGIWLTSAGERVSLGFVISSLNLISVSLLARSYCLSRSEPRESYHNGLVLLSVRGVWGI